MEVALNEFGRFFREEIWPLIVEALKLIVALLIAGFLIIFLQLSGAGQELVLLLAFIFVGALPVVFLIRAVKEWIGYIRYQWRQGLHRTWLEIICSGLYLAVSFGCERLLSTIIPGKLLYIIFGGIGMLAGEPLTSVKALLPLGGSIFTHLNSESGDALLIGRFSGSVLVQQINDFMYQIHIISEAGIIGLFVIYLLSLLVRSVVD